jgi:hypothetical protein
MGRDGDENKNRRLSGRVQALQQQRSSSRQPAGRPARAPHSGSNHKQPARTARPSQSWRCVVRLVVEACGTCPLTKWSLGSRARSTREEGACAAVTADEAPSRLGVK